MDKLRKFLKEKGLSTNCTKSELVHRVSDFIELESVLGAVAFSDLQVEKPIAFEAPFSHTDWVGMPVSELCMYVQSCCNNGVCPPPFKTYGAYTENYRTGVRLCQWHYVDTYTRERAKCRTIVTLACHGIIGPHYFRSGRTEYVGNIWSPRSYLSEIFGPPRKYLVPLDLPPTKGLVEYSDSAGLTKASCLAVWFGQTTAHAIFLQLICAQWSP